jgi:hypothetical protein
MYDNEFEKLQNEVAEIKKLFELLLNKISSEE